MYVRGTASTVDEAKVIAQQIGSYPLISALSMVAVVEALPTTRKNLKQWQVVSMPAQCPKPD